MQNLLSRTQAGPGRTVKKEQEEISPNHVQRLNLFSVLIKWSCHLICLHLFSAAKERTLRLHELARAVKGGLNAGAHNFRPTDSRGSLRRIIFTSLQPICWYLVEHIFPKFRRHLLWAADSRSGHQGEFHATSYRQIRSSESDYVSQSDLTHGRKRL